MILEENLLEAAKDPARSILKDFESQSSANNYWLLMKKHLNMLKWLENACKGVVNCSEYSFLLSLIVLCADKSFS